MTVMYVCACKLVCCVCTYVRTYVCSVYVHGSKIGRNGLIKDNLSTMGERGQVIVFLIL